MEGGAGLRAEESDTGKVPLAYFMSVTVVDFNPTRLININ